jgi:hypothetical protein
VFFLILFQKQPVGTHVQVHFTGHDFWTVLGLPSHLAQHAQHAQHVQHAKHAKHAQTCPNMPKHACISLSQVSNKLGEG